MAAGGTSWQHHHNAPKYPHMPPPHSKAELGGGGADIQDLHLKMSKKIAQLTKVIYALNTKNDEHESMLAVMKEAHEEETQKLLAETAAKIQHFRLKIGNEMDLRRRLQNLEEIVNASEREKRQAMIEFESFKRLVEEREMRLESDHALKVMSLTKELTDTKSEFERRKREFHDLSMAMRNESGVEVEKMNGEHQRELERLHSIIDETDAKVTAEKRELMEAHNKQIVDLTQEISNLKNEFKKTELDYENKMSKAKSFYERELEAIRSQMSSTGEEKTKRWQEREAEIRKEASKIEATLKNKLAKLEEELLIERREVESFEKKLADVVSQLSASADANSDLQSCLSKVQNEHSIAADQLRSLREELVAAQARLESQENDIVKKSRTIGTLEASRVTHEATIQDLERDIVSLKSRIEALLSERDALQNSGSERTQEMADRLQSLEKNVETITEEKTSLEKQFVRELEELKRSHAKEVKELADQHDIERQTTDRNHQSLVESMKTEAQNAMDGMLREMKERLVKEAMQLNEEKKEAVARVEAEKRELTEKLNFAQNELSRLEHDLQTHGDGLENATSHIKGLNARILELQRQVERSECLLRESETNLDGLRKDLEQKKLSYEQNMEMVERDHSNRIERLTAQLNSKWQDQLRTELVSLRTSLSNEHTQDKRSALEQLQTQKDREIEAARTGWQEQIKQLTSMISELKTAMEQQQSDFDRTLAKERSNAVENERALRQMASESAAEYSSKVSQLENAHRSEVVMMEQKKDQDLRSLEERLMSQHREDQQRQLQAHQIAFEALKERHGHELRGELSRKEQENVQELEDLRSELTHQHASAMDDLVRQSDQRLQTVRVELEKVQEVTRRQEADYSSRISMLEEDVNQKSMAVNSLEQKVGEQNSAVISLNKEVEAKGQEILHIRSEANSELRRREDHLTRKFQREQDQLEAESLRQKQALVGEYNRTLQAFKDQISSLSIALREAEDRFDRRESRPEDIQTINELKQLVRDKNAEIQKHMDDKKYYQLELVNRETNFNKVFSSSPNVGVLNPLNAQKKKGDKVPQGIFTSQYVSVPSVNSIESALANPNRLGPIRNGGPTSASSNASSTYSKPMQPTPPPHPKKFIRLDPNELDELLSDVGYEDGGFNLSRYRPDDFEGSLLEFDRECQDIESRRSISGSCQSLNQLDLFAETAQPTVRTGKSVLTRSSTLPLDYLRPQTTERSFRRTKFDENGEANKEDGEVCDVVMESRTRARSRGRRFKSSFSTSLPKYYLHDSTANRKNYAQSRFTKLSAV